MSVHNIGVVILAAGKGKRMKSDLPKVLHTIHGESMISLVLKSSVPISPKDVVVVVGHQSERVKVEVLKHFTVRFALQHQLLGTGDAVRAALPYLSETIETVLILCGDTPLIRTDTLSRLVDYHQESQCDITLLAVNVNNPAGYGRIVRNPDNSLKCIREEVDASEAERCIKTINAGIYCVSKSFLMTSIDRLTPDNAQKEYYLTDIVGIAVQNGYSAGVFMGADPREVMGVNTLEELRIAQELLGRLE